MNSGTGNPAIWQNVGARSTSPTGREIHEGVTPTDGAGRQINGSRINPST